MSISPRANHIPSVDLSDATAAARAMDAACSEFGYFVLENHGVETGKVLATIEEAQTFFARAQDDKARFRAGAATQFLGYRRLGAERSLSHGGAEACEQYRIGYIHSSPSDAQDVDAAFFHGPFAQSLELFADMRTLGDRLMLLAAVGRALEPDLFAPFFTTPMHRLGLNYYEPGSGERIGNAVGYGMSPHVDRAVFTVVIQSEPGLELLSPDGQWVMAPTGPDILIAFMGDYFERWTNGGYRATEHRVGEVRNDRISIQYKHKPSYATVVEPLAPFLRKDRAGFEPFDTGHQYERLLGTLLS